MKFMRSLPEICARMMCPFPISTWKVVLGRDSVTIPSSSIISSFAKRDSLLEGGRVEIRGFGSFKVKEYGSYAGRNPRTGEKVAVEPKRLPFFRAGKELKEYLNA